MKKKELAYELFITFALLSVVVIFVYMSVNALSGDVAYEYLQSMDFEF